MKCEFCGEEFEFEEDRDAHEKIKHPEQYQQRRAMQQMKELMGFFTRDFQHTDRLQVAAHLTVAALAHSKSPEEVFRLFDQTLAWLEGRMISGPPRIGPVPVGSTFLIDQEDVRTFLITQGISEGEIDICKKVSKLMAQWLGQKSHKEGRCQ